MSHVLLSRGIWANLASCRTLKAVINSSPQPLLSPERKEQLCQANPHTYGSLCVPRPISTCFIALNDVAFTDRQFIYSIVCVCVYIYAYVCIYRSIRCGFARRLPQCLSFSRLGAQRQSNLRRAPRVSCRAAAPI